MSSESPPDAVRRSRRGGARIARRRAKGLPGAIGLTTLSALVPGAGHYYSGRKAIGGALLLVAVVALVLAWIYLPRNLHAALDFAFDPTRLKVAAVVLGLALIGWIAVVVTTFVVVRPSDAKPWQSWVGFGFVAVLCLAVAAPVTVAARYAMVQADLVHAVFDDNETATAPKDVTATDPWGGRERVNVLLLGGDGGPNREGVRTDSMILVSINTETAKAVTFSLPRNMMYAQFPEHSKLHNLYPYGFTGEGDAGNWMLNAVYREVPLLHPNLFEGSHDKGADAIKMAVQGTTGLRVDYYALINLEGFQELVDAMGGVTVNINVPIAIGGNTDAGIPPEDYLDPGPNQHLDGWDALWYTRGRYGSDDYQRMDRQRCMINAIAEEADPLNLLRRYQSLAAAGKKLLTTDIPRDLLPSFVDLALDMKGKRMKSVVFRSSDAFNPGDPDFDYVRETVEKALAPHHRSGGPKNPAEEDSTDACAYDPQS